MTVKWFSEMFNKKQSDSMERRAEQSRGRSEDQINEQILEEVFNEAHKNLNLLIEDITNNKNHG